MENLDFESLENTRSKELAVSQLMRNVYAWMTFALVITGMAALLTARSLTMMTWLLTNSWSLWVLVAAELGLVFYLSARIERLSFVTATVLFLLYSLLNGVMLSSIFLVYSQGSIVSTFFICSGMFAAMAIIGSVTKKDLSAIGKFALMAVIGLIIALVVNMFLQSTVLELIVSVVGVVIFAALTAYDSQKIRAMLNTQSEVNEMSQKIALMGSLALYLDFVNLFLYLLRIFGRRN